MTSHQLPNDVFLVEGNQASCLYDLRKDPIHLFHLDEEATGCLRQHLSGGSTARKPSAEWDTLLQELVDWGLLEEIDVPRWPLTSISEAYAKAVFPTSAWVEITSSCDQRCVHCYGSFPSKGQTMSLGDMDRIASELERCGIRQVQIIGGEPLLAWQPTQYFLGIHGHRFESIELYTNGLHLDEATLAWLIQRGVRIVVSSYGTTVSQYERIAGGDDSLYVAHRNLLPRLETSGADYKVCLMRMAFNDRETRQTIADHFGIPVSKVREDIVRLTGRATKTLISEPLVSARQIRKETFAYPVRRHQVIRNAKGHSCFAGRIYIDSDLQTFPCAMERRWAYGSLREYRLDELLERARPIQTLTKDGIDHCRSCEYRYACFDCRPNNGSLNPYSKPWYCSYDPITATWQPTLPTGESNEDRTTVPAQD